MNPLTNRLILASCLSHRFTQFAPVTLVLACAFWLASTLRAADAGRLDITLSGNDTLISWTNTSATLEQALDIFGPWSEVVGATSPYTAVTTNVTRFFRLRGEPPIDPGLRYLPPTFTIGIGDPVGGCACTSPENPNAGPAVSGSAQDNGMGNVFLHTGELMQHAVDLSIPGRGLDWRFERAYRSGMNYDGPLGHGWDFNYNRRLFVETNGHVLRMDGLGRADRYTVSGANYQAPSGYYTKLLKMPDGSFVERDRHGMKWFYAPANGAGVAPMTNMSDRLGNSMTLQYNSAGQLTNVVDTLGRSVACRYDASGRLTNVVDLTGRTLQFGYDASGNLTSATGPAVTGTPTGNDFPNGKTTRYTYSSGFADARLNHNLLTCTAPNEVAGGGSSRLIAQYITDPANTNADRIQLLTLGGTNASGVPAGGTIAYQHQSLASAPPNDFTNAVFQTTVTDRNGNLAEYQFNQLGNIVRVREFSNRDVRPSDPAFFETRSEHNADGERTRVIHPEGNSVEHTYDAANSDRFQQGNLLRMRRVPDAARAGDQTRLDTTYTYEPLFNQVRTMTEPRGNDPAYVPQNGGANTSGRYTATNTFDYQEAAATPAEATTWGISLPPDLLGLGDVNGDGSTGQAMGNLVRRQQPTVNLLPSSNQALTEGDTRQEIIMRHTYNQFGQPTQMEDARGNIDTISYFPENDPDGDGLDLIAGRDASTGGYAAQTVRDAFVGPRRLDPPPAVAITNRFLRDRMGNITRRVDGRGFAWSFTYNALDQVVQEEKPKVDASQSTGFLRRHYYDANNNLVGLDVQNVTTDPANHLPVLVASHPFFQHRSTYDILDRLVEELSDATRDPAIPASSQPEQLTTRYRYDANENLARALSPQAVSGAEPNNFESFIYDERDLRYTATRGGASAQAATSTYDYDRNGNLARSTDAEDNDASAGPETETTLYDGFDRRRAVIDRAGNEQRFTYDPEGRVVRDEFFGPSTASSTTNTLLRRTGHLFDELGRRFLVDRALFLATGVTQQVATTLLDGPLTLGDGNVSERYEYDALSRMTFRVEDDNAVYRYDYDGAGRRIRETLPLVDNLTPGGPHPTRTEYEYDRNNNVVRRAETHTSPEGIVPPALLTYLYVYDALNRSVRVTDPLGQTHYIEYDMLRAAVPS